MEEKPKDKLKLDSQRAMNFSVVTNWEEGEKVSLEFLAVLGHPWQYRGEGNANIVIALQDELRVIRLSKVNTGEPVGDFSRHQRKVEREVLFANQIFVPLLGVEYVGLVQAVQIGTDQIDMLNQCLHSARPGYRLHKELKVPYATAHRDFARIHPYPSHRTDYCIEIKPKQGWWPKHLKNGVSKSDPRLCTYCLNQFLKLKRSKIASRTEYCPLDLFSGQPDRMIEAIVSLISNPQNNLRIFKDGRLVYGENMSDSLDFILDEWIQSYPDCDSVCSSTSASSQQDTNNMEPPSTISNLIYLLCMALLKPKRMPQGSRFQELNEPYEQLKTQIKETLLNSPSDFHGLLNPTTTSSTSFTTANSANDRMNTNDAMIRSCSDNTSPLPDGSILSRILDIQKVADIPGGVEKIYSIYKKICPTHQNQKSYTTTVDRIISDTIKDRMTVSDFVNDPLLPLPHMAIATSDLRPRLSRPQNHNSRNPHHHHNNNMNNNNNNRSCSLENCFCDDSGSELESLEEFESSSSAGEFSNEDYDNDEDDVTLKEDCVFEANKPDDMAKLTECDDCDCPSTKCLSDEKWLDEIPQNSLTKEEILSIEQYLLAATAKDCSIMITFSPVHGARAKELSLMEAEADSINSLYSPKSPSISSYKDSDLILEDLNGTFHRVRIGVADLDPKPVTSIVKHYLRDKDMINDFNEYLKNNPQ